MAAPAVVVQALGPALVSLARAVSVPGPQRVERPHQSCQCHLRSDYRSTGPGSSSSSRRSFQGTSLVGCSDRALDGVEAVRGAGPGNTRISRRPPHDMGKLLAACSGRWPADAGAPAEANVGAHSGVGRGPCPLTPPTVSHHGYTGHMSDSMQWSATYKFKKPYGSGFVLVCRFPIVSTLRTIKPTMFP